MTEEFNLSSKVNFIADLDGIPFIRKDDVKEFIKRLRPYCIDKELDKLAGSKLT